MGLWGGLKSIGRGIGKGVKKAGKLVGKEVKRAFDPIVKGVQGDWKGALAGIGHNIKRGAQVAAVLGSGGVAGVGLGTLGAAGGAIEGGFKEGGGGLKDIAGGALSGYGGVQTGKALGNIGRGLVGVQQAVPVAGGMGGGGAEAVVGGGGALSPDMAITNTMMGPPPPIPAPPGFVPSVPQGADWGNLANIGNVVTPPDPSMWSKGLDYARGQATPEMAMKMASQFMGGNQPAGDERYMPDDEPMMSQSEMEALERERLYRQMMMGGGSEFRPTSQYSSRWT